MSLRLRRHRDKDSLSISAQYHFSSIQDIAGELVRNSLDAGAKTVSVVVVEQEDSYGLRVTDDATTAFTSDSNSMDLIGEYQIDCDSGEFKSDHINHNCSYGFRGRSLFCIAQVAKTLIIKTRLNQECVVKTIKRGEESKLEEARMSRGCRGSIVEALGIFSMYPLRKKMIKIKSEMNGMKRMLQEFSLVHLTVDFRLYDGLGVEILHLRPSASLQESFKQVFPRKSVENVNLISFITPSFEIKGFYSICGTKNVEGQAAAQKHLFVNYLQENMSLLSRVDGIFQRAHQTKSFDFLIHIFTPSLYLDRNLTDNAFILKNEDSVMSFLTSIFLKSISSASSSSRAPASTTTTTASTNSSKYWPRKIPSATSSLLKPRGENVPIKLYWTNPVYKPTKPSKAIITKAASLSKAKIQISRSDFMRFQFLAQVDAKFLAFKLDRLLVLFDQHAVDERIKLEEFLEAYLAPGHLEKSQQYSITVKVKGFYLSALIQFQTIMKAYGFHYNTPYSVSTCVHPDSLIDVHTLITRPFLTFTDASKLFASVLDWLLSSPPPGSLPLPILEHFKSKACRSAIMFGDLLTVSECLTLLERLKRCKNPFQCAHGRPSLAPICYL